MPTDYKYKKKSSKNKFWNLSIWKIMYQTMVRERGQHIKSPVPGDIKPSFAAKPLHSGPSKENSDCRLAVLDPRFKPL